MVSVDIDKAVALFDQIVVLTNARKATVDELLSVDLQTLRGSPAIANHSKQFEYRSAALCFLPQRQRNVEPRREGTAYEKAKQRLHSTQAAR